MASGTGREDIATAIIGGAVITVAIFPLIAIGGLKSPNGDDTNEKVIEALPEISTSNGK